MTSTKEMLCSRTLCCLRRLNLLRLIGNTVSKGNKLLEEWAIWFLDKCKCILRTMACTKMLFLVEFLTSNLILWWCKITRALPITNMEVSKVHIQCQGMGSSLDFKELAFLLRTNTKTTSKTFRRNGPLELRMETIMEKIKITKAIRIRILTTEVLLILKVSTKILCKLSNNQRVNF